MSVNYSLCFAMIRNIQLGYYSVTHLGRQDAVILRRLRIGHTRVTHKYLLSADSQPFCNECKSALTYLTRML